MVCLSVLDHCIGILGDNPYYVITSLARDMTRDIIEVDKNCNLVSNQGHSRTQPTCSRSVPSVKKGRCGR